MSNETKVTIEKLGKDPEKKIKIQKDPDIEKLKIDLRKYPIRPHVGVGAVIIKDEKLLLIQRKYDPDALMWAIPGGHLDLGEKCKDCAEREILEETSIEIRVTDLAGVIDKIMFDEEEKIIYHYVLVNYYAQIIDERFKDGIPPLEPLSDTQDIKFVPFNEIKNYDITDSLKELLIKINILKI